MNYEYPYRDELQVIDRELRNHYEYKKQLETLQELVDKATPKKPDFYADWYGDKYWNCPCCEKTYEVDYDKYDYCPKCGQAIDWSVEDD